MILVYWIIQSKKYNGSSHLGIALSKKQILFLLLSEICLFTLLYLLFYFNRSPDSANDFVWQNIFFYFRGVWPIIGLSKLDDHLFRFHNPTWQCLIAAIVVDYLVLATTKKILNKK